MAGTRPCRFCRAGSIVDGVEYADAELCEFAHRDEQRIYDLALALAKVMQDRNPTDEQVSWFLEDADAVVDGASPTPEKWKVRKLPDDGDEFVGRFRINDVTYVIENVDGPVTAIRLSTLRAQQREAEQEARRG